MPITDCGRMQTAVARLLVGTEGQEIRLRLADDMLYIDKQQTGSSSNCLPRELQLDSALLTKVRHGHHCLNKTPS